MTEIDNIKELLKTAKDALLEAYFIAQTFVHPGPGPDQQEFFDTWVSRQYQYNALCTLVGQCLQQLK